MTAQPVLFTAPRPLTPRQQNALDLLTAAGTAGCTADQVGAHWCHARGKHPAGSRCQFDRSGGNDVLRALRKRGLVKQRRDGSRTWVALNLPAEPFGEIPF